MNKMDFHWLPAKHFIPRLNVPVTKQELAIMWMSLYNMFCISFIVLYINEVFYVCHFGPYIACCVVWHLLIVGSIDIATYSAVENKKKTIN